MLTSLIIGMVAALLLAYVLTRIYLWLTRSFFSGGSRIVVAYGLASITGMTLFAWMLSDGGPFRWGAGAAALTPMLALCLILDLVVARFRARNRGEAGRP